MAGDASCPCGVPVDVPVLHCNLEDRRQRGQELVDARGIEFAFPTLVGPEPIDILHADLIEAFRAEPPQQMVA
jgi:hypothetical protein